MMISKVSIIIPVYNIERFLTKCLDSCFNQTYQNIEVIAIDDGSDDKSVQILDLYAQKESRLQIIKHQENKGVVAAREDGLKVSKGDYICFIDGDDYIDPKMIEDLLCNIKEENSDISICSLELVNERGSSIRVCNNSLVGNSKEEVLSSMFLKKCTWNLCAKLFKRNLFNNISMPYNIKMGEDGLVCFQAVSHANKITLISKPYYKYVQHSSSVVHTLNKTIYKSVLEFVKTTLDYREIYKWDSKIEYALKNFILSQILVFYVYGGKAKEIDYKILHSISIIDILYSKINFKEKLLLCVFFKFHLLAELLRKIIQKRCLRL